MGSIAATAGSVGVKTCSEDLALGYEEADEEMPPDRTPPREAD